jgi:predicted transposase/invertase (TIGR01784 family)
MSLLLPLYNDFVFKALLVKNPDILLDILNSFPTFQGMHRIKEITILNPELPKSTDLEKGSILDIRATDESGRSFLIEMQGTPKPFLPERLVLYWAKVFAGSIIKGDEYSILPKVFSISFLNFKLIKYSKEFHTTFRILDVKTGKIALTDVLEMHTIELPKIGKKISSLHSDLEKWVYLFREAQNLKEEPLKELISKNPMMEKATTELEYLSQDPKTRQAYEDRLKAEWDYNTGMKSAYRDGELKGKKEGELKGKLDNAIETAKKMKEEGFNIEQIIRISGLSESQLKENGII